jgi:hypothetical protein
MRIAFVSKAGLLAAALGLTFPATGNADGRRVPPGLINAKANRVARGHWTTHPGNHGGRGFEQRVLHAVRNFDGHISLDRPCRPASP